MGASGTVFFRPLGTLGIGGAQVMSAPGYPDDRPDSALSARETSSGQARLNVISVRHVL